jgi:hypothetical protein
MPFAFALWLALLFGGSGSWDDATIIRSLDGGSGIPPNRAMDQSNGIPLRALDGGSGIPRQ